MSIVTDKKVIKEALIEIINEEPEIFKKVFLSMIKEEEISEEELKSIVKKNFKRFDATFKALA